MQNEKETYKIWTTTSNFPDAGTKSNVYLQIFGDNGRKSPIVSLKFPLQKSKSNEVKFQPGNTDLFELDEMPVSKIRKIRICQESKTSKWHLKSIIIELTSLQRQWRFYCNQSIVGDKPIELIPLKKYNAEYEILENFFQNYHDAKEKKKQKKRDHNKQSDDDLENENQSQTVKYKVKIKMSEFSRIESDLMLKMKMVGTSGQTKWIPIEDYMSPVNLFKADESDIGSLEKILISFKNDENGRTVDWFFDEIIVAIPKFKTYRFDSKSRTIVKKEKDSTILEIFPKEVKNTSKKFKYNVYVYARSGRIESNEMNFKLFGEFGNSGQFKQQLKSSLHDQINADKRPTRLDHIKNLPISFEKKFFDFGDLYKLEISARQTKLAFQDFERLTNSFIIVNCENKMLRFFHLKSRNSIKNADNQMIKIKFYEEAYIKKKFADELGHETMFDEPVVLPSDRKDRRRKSLDDHRTRRRSSASSQDDTYDKLDDYSDSFDSSDASRDERHKSNKKNRSSLDRLDRGFHSPLSKRRQSYDSRLSPARPPSDRRLDSRGRKNSDEFEFTNERQMYASYKPNAKYEHGRTSRNSAREDKFDERLVSKKSHHDYETDLDRARFDTTYKRDNSRLKKSTESLKRLHKEEELEKQLADLAVSRNSKDADKLKRQAYESMVEKDSIRDRRKKSWTGSRESLHAKHSHDDDELERRLANLSAGRKLNDSDKHKRPDYEDYQYDKRKTNMTGSRDSLHNKNSYDRYNSPNSGRKSYDNGREEKNSFRKYDLDNENFEKKYRNY